MPESSSAQEQGGQKEDFFKVADAAPPSSVTLPVMASSTWNTVWNLEATVTDPASGASVRVRSGVRVLLTESQKDAVCS